MAKSRKSNNKSKELINRVPTVFVDVYHLSGIFNKGERTIQNWVKEWRRMGMTPKKRGLYNLIECLKWRIKQQDAELLASKKGDEDENQARARLMIARANHAEFELALKYQEFIKITDAVFIVSEELLRLNTELDQLPQSAAADTLGMEDANQIETYLRDRINQAKVNIGAIADKAKEFAKSYSANMGIAEDSDPET